MLLDRETVCSHASVRPEQTAKAQFATTNEDIIRHPDEVRIDTAPNNYGIAFWSHDDGSRGTIVIWRPGSDGGTVFSPDRGYDYFADGDWMTNSKLHHATYYGRSGQ